MAVPKKKTTPSRRGMRRSHDKLKPINIGFDKNTGEAKLPHHVSLSDGFYNGRQIFIPKSKISTEIEGEGGSENEEKKD